MNKWLLRDFTEGKVKEALDQMAPLKAPGPDGILAAFYQENWSSIGLEVCKAIFNFFSAGYINEAMTETFIALILKSTHVVKVTDYRPISLCTILYKLITKTLVNRLKVLLPNIISPNQSAFYTG
jgi:hypothetical protein